MLDRAHRLTLPTQFRRVFRRGAKNAGSFVVLYRLSNDAGRPRFGFVTSKAVGNAPTRNKVRRQLRAIAYENLDSCTGDVVMRAMPSAATASWSDLKADVEKALIKFEDTSS